MDFCKQMDFYLFCSFLAHKKDKKTSYTKLEGQNIFLVLLTLADAYCKGKIYWNANVSVLTEISLSLL